MDNLETPVDSAAATDVNVAPAEQSIDGTQPLADSASVDAGTEEVKAASFPWEGDDRFKGKTPDDMYKIVTEADKYKGELGQKAKLADMLGKKFGLTPERMEQIVAEREQAATEERYKADPTAPIREELETVKQHLAAQAQKAVIQEEDAKLDKFLQEKPEFSGFREEIRRLGYTIERDSNWNEVADKYFGRAIVTGQESAYAKMGVKQSTQASGVSKDIPKGKPSLDDLSNLSSKELENLIP